MNQKALLDKMSDDVSQPSRRISRRPVHLQYARSLTFVLCVGVGVAMVSSAAAAAGMSAAGVSSAGQGDLDQWQQHQHQHHQQDHGQEHPHLQHRNHHALHHHHQRRLQQNPWTGKAQPSPPRAPPTGGTQARVPSPAARYPSPSPVRPSPPSPPPPPRPTPSGSTPPSPTPGPASGGATLSPTASPAPGPAQSTSPKPSSVGYQPPPSSGKLSPPVSAAAPPPMSAGKPWPPASLPPPMPVKPSPSLPPVVFIKRSPPPVVVPPATPVALLPPVPITGVAQNLLSENSLYAVKYQGATSTELHATSAASNFTRLYMSVTTALPKTNPANYQFILGSNEDLYAVNTSDIMRPVVLILSRASSYNSITRLRIGLPAGILTNLNPVQFLLGSKNDLYVIKPSGNWFVDIYVLPRASNYSKLVATIHTALPKTNASTYRFQMGSNDDLYAVKYSGTSGFVEVNVLSRASYYQNVTTLITDFPRTTDLAFQFLLLQSKQQDTLFAVQNGALPRPQSPPPPLPLIKPPPAGGSTPSPSPPSGVPANCSTGFSCILPQNFPSGNLLQQDPFSIVGNGFLFTGSGKIFSDFPINDLIETARTSSELQTCPFLSLSAYQISQLAGGARYVGGLVSSELGGVPEACTNIVGQLVNSTRYVMAIISIELFVYAPSDITAHDMEILQGSNMSICGAIDPCTGVYHFGFDTQAAPPGQALGLFQDPFFSSVLTISSMSFSSDSSKLTQRLERIWNPADGFIAGGSFSSAVFRSKLIVTGTPKGIVDSYMELGASIRLVARADSTEVASFVFVDEIRDNIQMAWDPVRIDSGVRGGDIIMALNLKGTPRMSFAGGSQELDLSDLADTTTIHGLWASYMNGSYVLQLSTITPLRMDDVLSRLGSHILRTVYRLFADYSYSNSFGTTVSVYIAPGRFSLRIDISFDQPGAAGAALDASFKVPNPTDGKLGVVFENTGSGPYSILVMSNGRAYSL